MQKGKLIIAGIVLTLSPALYAADTAEIIPAQQVVQAEGTPPLRDVSPMQDHVVEMIEKDFNFESQYRELANQLALEKVRSELRGEKKADSVAVMPVSTASTMDDISASPGATSESAPGLRPLLISEIAGQKRVAIAGADGGVKMVPLNQRFSYGGYDYIARHNQANDVTVEVVGK
ncbi:hypothetical protein L7Q45_000647 [Citrobacter braakii]|uniref:hypothetical protein n=1 Tax=Citrobacter braakii TaxID=57706 RepID=UPI0005441B6E|nr:hypothetical protein [Citrobacter braakii]EIV2906391.1 hypothetical protein [Citrobacter braakii]KHE09896.1 hypothetical protein LH87_08565 [Citrobacter braakii]